MAKKIVIFTGGKVRFSKMIRSVADKADVIIAADMGTKTAFKYGYTPKIVVGDFDSLGKKTLTILKMKNVECIVSPAEKDETDTELAIQYAVEHGAKSIDIIGGIEGDRIDHILGNIFLLTKIKAPVRFLNGNTIVWLEYGPKKVKLSGNIGDTLSLIPLSQKVTGITTEGLCYPLRNETLNLSTPRGISNVFTSKNPTVSFKKGLLLLVHISYKL